jgi:hypothetical protein
MPNQEYDIIGDIHGHADKLVRLLEKLEYSLVDGRYQHATRKVIFLGDFIDRGPKQRDVLQIVMPMVQQGSALAVMGNHEFNALAFHTNHVGFEDRWLRVRNNKNIHQHIKFLEEYLPLKDEQRYELRDALDFFYTLPLWRDLGGIRVVHACWEPAHIQYLESSNLLTSEGCITPAFLARASQKGTPEYEAIEALLKGVEYNLPSGQYFTDKDGHNRTEVRTKWWINEDTLLENVVLPSGILDDETGKLPISSNELVGYATSEKPVFFGHYWFQGTPEKIASNVACLDYSVAKNGKLVAYRWSGEASLSNDNFVFEA